MSLRLALALTVAALTGLQSACGSRPAESPTHGTTTPAAQQEIVDEAAQALLRMRQNPRFSAIEQVLPSARGVLIFPRVVKASLIFGGEGGNGILVARRTDGTWSAPAFYSLGAPSVGLQIGYREATIILFLMNDWTVQRIQDADLKIGSERGSAIGNIGEDSDFKGRVYDKDIYQLVEAGGAFAGISVEGYVIGPRSKHNSAYYGSELSPAQVLQTSIERPGTETLKRALLAAPTQTPAAADLPPPPPPTSTPAAPEATSEASTPLKECSPEARQASACIKIYQPVCAELDTGVRCIKAPCPESRKQQTFGNACEACQKKETMAYRDGACP